MEINAKIAGDMMSILIYDINFTRERYADIGLTNDPRCRTCAEKEENMKHLLF